MTSYDSAPAALEGSEIPPRPETPAVRWSFVLVLLVLLLAAVLVYGVPHLAFQAGDAYESGRAKAASESLASLDSAGIIQRASELFRQAATATTPAVVSIQCSRDASTHPDARELPEHVRPRGPVPTSFGSGVVIDKAQGYIVTNGHVVDGADEIQVRLGQGQEKLARLVGADSKTDLAVLQVNGPLEAEAEWADLSKVEVGDWVLAIGSPFMLEHSVSVGIVSAIGRRNLPLLGESSAYQDFIQTDAAINPGNSGGPLVDLRGRIVGINTAIFSPQEGVNPQGRGGNVGIGFALSASLAKHVVSQIIENGRVSRGYMGVILDNLDQARAAQLGLPDSRGAMVVDIDPEGPAAAGGLRPGDVIVALADEPVRDLAELRNRTAMLPIGQGARLTYYRDGQRVTSEVSITALPVLRSLGLWLEKGPETGAGGRAPGVGVAAVQRRSVAFQCGFRTGQRVIAIENRSVSTADEAEAVAARFDPATGFDVDVLMPDGRPRRLRIESNVGR